MTHILIISVIRPQNERGNAQTSTGSRKKLKWRFRGA